MNYIECSFELTPFEPFHEILIAELSDLPFESFVEEAPFVKAYLPKTDFDEAMFENIDLFHSNQLNIRWSYTEIPQENWNKKWETSFEAIEIADFCTIRAPFHTEKSGFQYEIIIEPKMSFGTGHHETTQLMIREMQNLNLKDKKVLDMGSGTAILSILAEKMGADRVHSIDIEEWAFINMKENIERNHCKIISTKMGGEEQIDEFGESYDCILANINKNILIKQFDIYMKRLNKGGDLLISGFFPSDAADFKHLANKYNLIENTTVSGKQWSMLHFTKRK